VKTGAGSIADKEQERQVMAPLQSSSAGLTGAGSIAEPGKQLIQVPEASALKTYVEQVLAAVKTSTGETWE
jgi:hypothetical protein